MECPNGGLDWSHTHNSPFEITKLVVMDFSRTPKDVASSQLTSDRLSGDRTRIQHPLTTVDNYKYLGVIFDPKLTWGAQVTRVTAKATWWTHQLWRLSKTAGGLPPSKTHQLYNTVAILAFTYACNIWYTPPFKLAHSRNTHGSNQATKILCSIQG